MRQEWIRLNATQPLLSGDEVISAAIASRAVHFPEKRLYIPYVITTAAGALTFCPQPAGGIPLR